MLGQINETIQWGLIIIALYIANKNFFNIDRAIRHLFSLSDTLLKLGKETRQDLDELIEDKEL